MKEEPLRITDKNCPVNYLQVKEINRGASILIGNKAMSFHEIELTHKEVEQVYRYLKNVFWFDYDDGGYFQG